MKNFSRLVFVILVASALMAIPIFAFGAGSSLAFDTDNQLPQSSSPDLLTDKSTTTPEPTQEQREIYNPTGGGSPVTTSTVYIPLAMLSYTSINTITDIVFDPPSPASLDYWEPVSITFSYNTVYNGAVQMWAIGYADGESQPYRGSPSYPAPSSGVITRAITVFSGAGSTVIDTLEFCDSLNI
jgi:hypothetical protein